MATAKAIKYACLNFHYAKAIPVNPIGYNVYNNSDEWCGCILFARGACKSLGDEYGLPQGAVLELVRVALNGKQECTSKAVAIALKRLKTDCPLCKLVVSFADCDQNHLGTIYQATNWIYTGTNGTGLSHAYLIDGKKIHEKSVRQYVKSKGLETSIDNIKFVYKTSSVSKFITQGKRKYLMPMDKVTRKKILPLAKPYPKEEGFVKVNYKAKFGKVEKESVEKK